MNEKIKAFKLRRFHRLMSRMDADSDGGRWVTTENDNRVHLNENGVPDKGNPYVISAMTGKKPKVSVAYRQKKAQGILNKGWDADIDSLQKEFENLPNGTVIKTKDKSFKREGDHFVDEKTGEKVGDGWDVGYELKHKSKDKNVEFVGPEKESASSNVGEVKSPENDFSEQKSKIQALKDDKGTFHSVGEFHSIVDDLPHGTKVVVDGDEWTKVDDNTYKDVGGMEHGPSFFCHKLKKSKTFDIHGPSSSSSDIPESDLEEAVFEDLEASNGAVVGGEGNKSPEFNAINNCIDKWKNGGYVSKTDYEKAFLDLGDGSVITIGDTEWEKKTDSDGDPYFVTENDPYGIDPLGMKGKLNWAVVDGDPISFGKIDPTEKAKKEEKKKYVQDPDDYDFSTKAAIVGIPSYTPVIHSVEDFTPERKSAAVWDKEGGKLADDTLRPVTGAVWRSLDDDSKYDLWSYTGSLYGDINQYMRGDSDPFWGEDWKNELKNKVDRITSAIAQSEAPTDMWLQRGCSGHSLGKLFGVSESDFDNAKAQGAKAIFDILSISSDYGQDLAFMSCGSSKNSGFNNKEVVMNIYCPKGTKMMYAEPFSKFGDGGYGKNWNGESKQKYFSNEDETILQRGTMMVPRKVSVKGGRIYVDMDVIGQDY